MGIPCSHLDRPRHRHRRSRHSSPGGPPPAHAVGGKSPHAPWWAYLGGISGAATVILTSTAVNSPLGLSGTLALGLAGQVAFSVAADSWGLFGLPKRHPDTQDIVALGLVVMGLHSLSCLGEVRRDGVHSPGLPGACSSASVVSSMGG